MKVRFDPGDQTRDPFRPYGLAQEIQLAIPVIIEAYRDLELNLVSFTSGRDDDGHSRKSKHYSGLAIDVDWFDSPTKGAAMKARLQDCLPDYDVVFEGSHFHVEYDPVR